MNGGVTPIVAGELAHGAFLHGHEEYAADILRRLSALGKRHHGMFHSAYTGALPAPPARDFMPLDIRVYANTDVSGSASIARNAAPAWIGEGENDLHELPAGSHVLAGVPFLIPEPASNQRRACIGLSERPGYAREVTIPVQRSASAIYFLHTTSKTSVAGIGGTITLHYEDGSTFTRYVVRGVNVSGWWFPEAPYDEHQKPTTAVAWRGKNAHCPDVGVIAYGLDNPHPALLIDRIVLTAAAEGAFWGVMGVTLSNQPVYFPPRPISFGIPAGWGAAAVMYALVEGLAGVVDQDVAYRHVSLSPRWAAAGVEQASALVKYPASQGYLAYRYRHDPQQGIIELAVTGSGELCSCHLLLPPAARQVLSVEEDQGPLEFTTSRIEQSHYADFTLKLPAPRPIKLRYA